MTEQAKARREPLSESQEGQMRWRVDQLHSLDNLEAQELFATLDAARQDLDAARQDLDAARAATAAAEARILELEDTIRLREADDDVARSYGRNTDAVRIAEDIHRRRGEDWRGATLGDWKAGGGTNV